MQNSLLKYANYDIVFQEVPNEVSLALNITGCTHHCDGCHSEYLSNDIGNYVDDDLPMLLKKYKGMITCVCFMGGDQCIQNLNQWLKRIKEDYHLKTCVYSGAENESIFANSFKYLDYLKIGPFQKEKGGLDSENTNQVFWKVDFIDENYTRFSNFNYKFQEKYKNFF